MILQIKYDYKYNDIFWRIIIANYIVPDGLITE